METEAILLGFEKINLFTRTISLQKHLTPRSELL